VDIGGTGTKAGLVSPDGHVSAQASIPTKPGVESFFSSLVVMIAGTLAAATTDVNRIGVAVAGFVDETRSHLAYNSNLPWLENFPLRQRLQNHFPGFSIELEIDSNASTMAEYRFGSGQGASRFLCLTCGTGLGVGMTIDGVPLRFAYGCMGDIGHTILLRNGPVCACGGRGCAEVLLSSTTLAENYKARKKTDRDVTLRDVIEAAKDGEPAAISILETAGEWLGMAVSSMANTFFPDHIAIAGGLSAAGEIVLKPAERVFRETACEFAKSKATFSLATLGSSATLVGAAWPFWNRNPVV
jgi:glucokinase